MHDSSKQRKSQFGRSEGSYSEGLDQVRNPEAVHYELSVKFTNNLTFYRQVPTQISAEGHQRIFGT